MPTAVLRIDHEADLQEAARLLDRGDLVAIPTETVYGLAADATNAEAVAQIFHAKGRPSFNPLIVHLSRAEQASHYAQWPKRAAELAEAFWPGPLTLVLPARPSALAPAIRAGHDTVALRVPAHAASRQVIETLGRPVAAPSANLSGKISPTTAAHVLAGLAGRIDAVLDGGATQAGIESTILSLSEALDAPTVLREGAITADEITARLGCAPRHAAPGPAHAPTAPGQLDSHYAPRAAVRLNATEARPGEALLGFGPVRGDETLSAQGDLAEAAANLYAALHRLDRAGASAIAVAPIPDAGLGAAINDRLRRAAAPRPR